jgi:hypothetical protein
VPFFKNCFTAVEVAGHFGVPVSTARLAIDRLGIGHRFNRTRVVYPEDFGKLALAFRVLGYEVPAGLQQVEEEAVAGH